MSEKNTSLETWMNAYPTVYSNLFDDGRTPKEEVEARSGPVALSALARYAKDVSWGIPSAATLFDRAQVAQAVNVTLDACVEGTFGDDQALAFAEAGEYLRPLKSSVSSIVLFWEYICEKKRHRSPFTDAVVENVEPDDFQLEGTQAILMVAAGLLFARSKRGSLGSQTNLQGVRSYGPRFTQAFLAGADVTEYLGEAARPLNDLTYKAWRMKVLASSPQNIVGRAKELMRKLQECPSTSEIAQELEWSEGKVDTVFPRSKREAVAVHSGKPFMEVARRIKYLYEEVVTISNIAQELQMEWWQAYKTFSPWIIRKVVFSKPFGDPIKRLGDILRLSQKIARDYPMISLALAKEMAVTIPRGALERADYIAQKVESRPPHIPPRFWARLVYRFPEADKEYLQAYLSRSTADWYERKTSWQVYEASEADSPGYNYFSLSDSTSYGVSLEDRDLLQRLIKTAAFSQTEVRELYDFFSEDNPQETPSITSLLERLRAVASKVDLD